MAAGRAGVLVMKRRRRIGNPCCSHMRGYGLRKTLSVGLCPLVWDRLKSLESGRGLVHAFGWGIE